MKSIISAFLMISMFTLAPLAPTPALAAPTPNVAILTEAGEINSCPRGTYRVRRHTSRGKRITNALIAGGIGAAIGGGIRGGRGALVGLGSGAGGYLIYRYVRDRRGRCVPRYVRG